MSNMQQQPESPPTALLIEDLRAILTERRFNIQQELICCKWELGERLVTDPCYRAATGKRSFVKLVAAELGISSSDAYYCCQFYTRFPTLNPSTNAERINESFPTGGKALTWTYIRDNYLPQQDKPRKRTRLEAVEAYSEGCIGAEWTEAHHQSLVKLMQT